MDKKYKNTAVICLSKVNGGMELASVKLAKLLSQDVKVDFIAKKDSYIECKSNHKFEQYDIKLHTIDFKGFFNFKLIKEVRKIIIEQNIENIVFLGASEMRSLYFSTYSLDINFIIRQGSKKSSSKKDFIHKLLYSKVKHFIGNCEYIKQNIVDIIPLHKNTNVQRIYSSFKIPIDITTKESNSIIDIILVGRIHPFKGQLEAIKTCKVLYDNNITFKLKFLGDTQDTDYFNNIQSYLKTCDYKDSVEFLGYKNNVKDYLQRSDIFLFPSLGEGMSNAIIESLGFGLIPIIYDDTSSPEFKKLGFHIHLTKENTILNLQDILLNVASNITLEKTKASSNMQLTQQIFSPDREKNEYLTLLR
jgi:glycosyltransferase involved in cell wall biosynthesis